MKQHRPELGRIVNAALGVALSGSVLLAPSRASAQTFPQTAQWIPLTQNGAPIGDPLGDSQVARDIVGDATNPAVYVYSDGTYLYLRMRIDGTVLQAAPNNYKPFGWACAIDTDGVLTSYELIAGVDGIQNPDVVELLANTQQTPDSPKDIAETLLMSYSVTTHAREVAATSSFGGDPDFFIDWAVKLSDMTGVTATTPLRFACGTSNNARSLAADLVGLGNPTTLTGLWSTPFTCGSAGCGQCSTAAACGPTCAPCGGSTPFCDTTLSKCVGCQTNANCSAPTSVCSPTTKTCTAGCSSNTDCSGVTPICNTGVGVCVGCLTNQDCKDQKAPTCNQATFACECAGGPAKCTDTDGDGLVDATEVAIGTDPKDADTDDDGALDGQESSPELDSDGDGLINAKDPDSDDDGLYDGTELGLACSATGTDVTQGHCTADADSGTTKTDPLKADTDGGGAKDGSEDANLNGAVDSGEQNPTTGNGADDTALTDTDKDGLSNALEATLGSDPNDADSDDDGLHDGLEHNPADDTDGDGLDNVLDADSDDDGLFDGTEAGKACDGPTNAAAGHCIADGDAGQTKTFVLVADTDGGGALDGSEDANRNGVVDAGEQNPVMGQGGDDPSVTDTDKDGLGDALETNIGTSPSDADSDDDGLPDGEEPNPSDDHDGDGKKNPLDSDSDGDGLKDGTEAGRDCANAATDASKGECTADADPTTTTGVLTKDTDRGGIDDGSEDANKNGKVDSGETDPNVKADDTSGTGGAGGTGGVAGSGGSMGGAAGVGGGTGGSGGAAGGGGTGGSALDDEGLSLEGGGCGCSAPASGASHLGWLAAAGLLASLLLRRRRG